MSRLDTGDRVLARTPLREPATILRRPSALAATRAAWVLVAALVTVLLPPEVSRWCPWWFAPLVIGCVLDAGAWCACAWLLTGEVLLALMPPGGGTPLLDVAAGLVALLGVVRLRGLAQATPLAPLLLGATASLLHDLTAVMLAAASSGRVSVDVWPVLVRAVASAVFAMVVVPAWVGWAERQRERGRA